MTGHPTQGRAGAVETLSTILSMSMVLYLQLSVILQMMTGNSKLITS
jgi:hypothetical protein